jgi:hypothetical protein
MSDKGQSGATVDPGYGSRHAEPTGWVGLVVFGGIMMVLLGFFQGLQGLVAIFNDTYYLVTRDGLVLSFDYTVWGWIHLLFGIVALIAGFGVLAGMTWARVVGVIVAVLSALVNFVFFSAYPIWSTIIIVVDVLVIYALVAHGREVRDTDRV